MSTAHITGTTSGKYYNLGKLFAATLLLLIGNATAFAQGDLLISPLRIIFEGSKKSQEISLANVGKDTAEKCKRYWCIHPQ
jgi:P pilus assembly chaperone PapD